MNYGESVGCHVATASLADSLRRTSAVRRSRSLGQRLSLTPCYQNGQSARERAARRVEDGTSPFAEWFAALDAIAAAKITVALGRIG